MHPNLSRILLTILVITASLFLYPFLGKISQASGGFENPHGSYATDPRMCGKCHVGHSGLSQLILTKTSQKETCYNCHDGAKSNINVKAQFGEVTVGSSVYSSFHPVPTGEQQCSTCHDPHLAGEDVPRLLAVGDEKTESGNEVCGNCHGSTSSLRGGDLVADFVYTAHNTDMPNPASGTQIKCVQCHEPHGSPYEPLIKETITDKYGTVSSVTGNNNSLCFGCHTPARDKYAGKDMFNSVFHGSKTSSTVALTVYPGTAYLPGQCLNCHEPHGKTGIADYKRAAGNQLCITCHDDSSLSRPSAYSYRGINTYNLTPHSSAKPMPATFIYNMNTAGASGWQSSFMPTPTNPGTPATADQLSAVAGIDASLWTTDLVVAEGAYNYHMYRFPLTQDTSSLHLFDIKWIGYGEPTTNHTTDLFIWNKSTTNWQQLDSRQLGTEGTLTGSLSSNMADYVDADKNVYIMAQAKHDGTGPVVSAGWGPKFNTTSKWADITWTTDENSTTYVDFGTTTSYGATVEGTHWVQSHSVRLANLTPGQLYYYRIRTTDALGNETVKTGSFTAQCGSPVLQPVAHQSQQNNWTFTENFKWNAVSDPNGSTVWYDVQVSLYSNFSSIHTQLLDTTATSWTTTVTQPSGYGTQTWYWRVRAKDSYGSVSNWSVGTFTTDVYSCPILYTWDGEKYRFVTDLVAGANIGLEMSPGKYLDPVPNEQITISGSLLAEKDDYYTLKIKNEQNEVDYIDNLILEAVDHPIGTQIGLNDFVRHKEPYMLYTYSEKLKPVKEATLVINPTWSGGDPSQPVDITDLISKVDNRHATGQLFDDNQFTLNLGDLTGAKEIKLVITGWTEFATAEERDLRVQKDQQGLKTAPRLLEILQPDGTWTTEDTKHIPGYTKTAVIDLTGKFPAEAKEFIVRLRGMYRPHIDFIGVDTSGQADLIVTPLTVATANLEYGAPSDYVKYPSPSFDYYKKREYNLWSHEGRFTRYGDVLPLVQEVDDMLVVMDTGDELTVSFEAPPLAPGMTRSFVLKPWAYYKELSEAKVEPMPFRAMDMSKYPASLGDYPEELQKYVQEWNTREHYLSNGKVVAPERENLPGVSQNKTPNRNSSPEKYVSLTESIKLLVDSLRNIFFTLSNLIFGDETNSQNSQPIIKADKPPRTVLPLSKPFIPEEHYSLNTNYIELKVRAADGVTPSGDCTICHAVHGTDSGLGTPYPKQLKSNGPTTCFGNGIGCHSDSANSASGINIQARFTTTAGYTSRHSVDLTEQSLYSSKVECINCHDPHLNDAVNKTVNPDNRYTVMNQWVDTGVTNYIYSDGTVYLLAKAKHDGTPPVISSINQTVNNAAYSATITWNTNEKSTRELEWGTTTDYVYFEGSSSTFYNSPHSVTLSNLQVGTEYHYRIRAMDQLSNVSYSTDRTFKLSSPPGVASNLRHTPNPLPSGNHTESVRLEWDAAVDPDGDPVQYYVEIIGAGNSGWLPVGQTWWDTSVSNYDTVTYSWRVKAKDAYGAEGEFSGTASFSHTGDPTPPPSCPILYTWDGKNYTFISDIVAGSNVGLKLAPGKYITPAPGEQIAIPGNKLVAKNGLYTIKIKNERDEIDFIDNLVLQAVDHPIGTNIALNDFVRDTEPFKVYTYSDTVKPVRKATYVNNPSFSGGDISAPVDITALVSKVDNIHAKGTIFDDNQFTFDLGDLSKAPEIKLVVVGWTEFATTQERAERVEKAQKGIKTAPRLVEVLQPDGTWKSEVIKHIPGHTKTIVLDLKGKFPEDTKNYVVRLRGMYRPHFDFVGLDTTPQAELKLIDLQPTEAILNYRGVAKSGSYPSPYYDYNNLSDIKLQHKGKFTRYGDVLPLVKLIDDKLVVMDSGDELTVNFEALPPPALGMTRSFVLKPWAYYKELEAAQVEPMPFREMNFADYPKSLGKYPDELKDYIKEWNTREHNPDPGLWYKVVSKLKLMWAKVSSLFTPTPKLDRYYKTEVKKDPEKNPEHYSLNTNYAAIGIGTPEISKYYLPNSPDTEAWEKGTLPTFDSPGYAAGSTQKDNASTRDSNYWSTDLATAEGAYNYQLYKFKVSEAVYKVNRLSVKWVGYGEPTPNHETAVYIWNFSSQSWQQLGSGQYNSDTLVKFFKNKENSTFCNKCHDNAPPAGVSMGVIPLANLASGAINNYHGDYAGTSQYLAAPYVSGTSRLACDDCHDPHGSNNLYHLRETVNGVSGISITHSDGTGAKVFCGACHTGDLVNNWHAECMQCHPVSGDHYNVPPITESLISNCFRCHGHAKEWYNKTSCNDCHGSGTDHNWRRTF